LAAALLAYAGLGVAVAQLHWGPHGYCALALAVLLVQIRFSPARQTGLSPMRTTSAEVLCRMVLAAVLVILVTALAQRIGPEHTGVLTAFPIASTVIAVFSHQRYSSSHSIQSLKALKQELLSLLLFFYVLAVMTAWLSFEQSFIAAVFAAVLLQTLVARLGRRAASG
jgi:hypothetical protein